MRNYDAWKTRTPEDEQFEPATYCPSCREPCEDAYLINGKCEACNEDDERSLGPLDGREAEDLARGESDYEDRP